MSERGTIWNGDEAARFVAQIQDPVTKRLVNLAFVHFVKKILLENQDPPQCNLDALFLVQTLEELFSQHEVIARTLEGEIVGAWFDEE
jgi:hypothetical protein